MTATANHALQQTAPGVTLAAADRPAAFAHPAGVEYAEAYNGVVVAHVQGDSTRRSFRHQNQRRLTEALGFLAVVIALLFCGCGSLVRVEYQNPKYGGGAVEFALPKKEGYANEPRYHPSVQCRQSSAST